MAINKGKIRTAAQRYAEKGNYDRAIEEYLKIVKEDPKDAHILLKVGELFAKKGNKEQALAHFRKAAEIFFDEGFDVKAAGVLKQILALDPTDVGSSIALARYYKTKGMVVDALAHLDAVYRWLVRHERNDDALVLAKEMVSLDPDNVAMRIRLAEAYSRQDRRAEAVAEFAVAADLLRAAERIDDFIKVAERLLWHQPDNVAISKELATLYLRKKEPRRALQKLQVCFKSDPQDVETLELLAEAFEQLEQTAKAATILKELAKIFQAQGKRDEASDVYARVLDMVPDDEEAKEALAKLRPARPSEAFHQVHTMPVAAERESEPEPAYSFDEESGVELLDEEDVEELTDDAIVEVEEDDSQIARILSETDVFVRYRLFDKAVAHLQQVLESRPDHVEALRRLAEVFVESGRVPEAVEAYRRLADLLAESDIDAAGRALAEALSLAPDDDELAREYERLTGEAAPVGEPVAEDEFEEDLADLSGLQLLEDIEAEAEEGDSVYATQELSFQGRKSPFLRGSGDGESEEVDLAEMAELGLLDEVDESGDVVDLGELADSALFADQDMEPDSTLREGAVTARDVLEAADRRGQVAPDATLSDMEGGVTAAEVAAAAGMETQGEREAGNAEGEAVVFSDDLDLELDKLEEEFGSLSAEGLKEELEVPARDGGAAAADTAMVSMEAFEEALEEPEDAGDEDLDLLPPSTEFDDEEVSDTFPAEDVLGDELEQLEETGALLARLEKETGDHESVEAAQAAESAAAEQLSDAEPEAAHPRPAVDSELDFSGLMDEEPVPAPVSDSAASPDASESGPDIASQGAVAESSSEMPVAELESEAQEDAFSELVEAAESALEDVGAPAAEAEAERKGEPAGEPAGAEQGGEGEPSSAREEPAPIATSELQLDDLASAWGGTGEQVVAAESAATEGDGQAEEAAEAEAAAASELDEETLESLEADIEDTEFFIEQGLYHDALDMLEELREQYGNHPLLEQKIEEVRRAAGQELVGEEESPEESEKPEDVASERGVPFESGPKQSVKVMGAAGGAALGEGDAETHFDLGIAYRDMGLLDQAMEEFRKVTSAPSRAVQAHLMISGCLRDQGRFEDAVSECEAALLVETITKAERLETHYQLGDLLEAMGKKEQAREAFETIQDEAPSYRDVEERLERLRS